MRAELSHVSNVLAEHYVNASLPLYQLLGKFVALFQERVRDMDSKHAFVCRDDFVSMVLDILGPSMEVFAEQMFSALIDLFLLSASKEASETTEHHELVDVQLFVVLFLLMTTPEPNQNREQMFYGLIGDIEQGSYFQLEKVLFHLLYYSTEMTTMQSHAKARGLVLTLEETYLANVQRFEQQEKREKDKKRVKKLWDTFEHIDLEKRAILKQILLSTVYIPNNYKSRFLETQKPKEVSLIFDAIQFSNDEIPSKLKYNYEPRTRPPPKYKLDGYVITPLSGKHRKRQRRYAKLDIYAMNTIQEDEVDTQTLSNRLCSLARNDEERFRVFFLWVTHNIEFDPSCASSDSATVFNSRRGNSEGFANLFATLCESKSLRSEVISGVTNDKALKLEGDHFWNSVALDKHTYFVDCTLGSGLFDGEKHTKQLRNYYFLVPPESFIDNHYPNDPSKQYLTTVVTPEVYADRNILLYKGSEFGLTMSSFSTSKGRIELKNANTIRIQFIGDDVEYKVILRDHETGEEAGLGETELFNEKKHKYKLRARIPEPLPKEYILELCARHKIPEPEDEEAEEEDEEDEDTEKKPKEPEPEFELLIQWTVSKLIEKKEKPKEEEGQDDEENDGEEEDGDDEDVDDADDE